jgi:transcriptional regulator with XRE-family HTH domain
MDVLTGQQFAEVLRGCRLRRGVTQQQLAELSAVSVRALRELEIGRVRRPRRDTVRLIADGLGLTGRARAEFEAAARRGDEAGKPADFAAAAPMPAVLDGLLGRDAEVRMLRDLLGAGGHRLVTLTGLAGIGKTRLALEVAGELRRDQGLPVLWLGPGADLAPMAALVGDRPALLVLDGHPAGPFDGARLAALLRDCRELRILLTSRAPLGIAGERTVPVTPLAVPGRYAGLDLDALARVPSVRLLLRHARRTCPDFELTPSTAPAVAELCRLLDGIPLVLEAVAAWFLVYEPADLLDLVRRDPFGVLDHRADLHEHLDRILVSLDPAERALLGGLADLRHGWSVRDAVPLARLPEAVCASLVRRLLLRGLLRPMDTPGQVRFRVLDLVRFLLGDTAASRRLQSEAV